MLGKRSSPRSGGHSGGSARSGQMSGYQSHHVRKEGSCGLWINQSPHNMAIVAGDRGCAREPSEQLGGFEARLLRRVDE